VALCIAAWLRRRLAPSPVAPALTVAPPSPPSQLILVCFGIWPGMLVVRGRNEWDSVPITVAAPHLGLLEAFWMMSAGIPRPIALEPYTKIPVVGAIFRAAKGIAVPLPKAMPDNVANKLAAQALTTTTTTESRTRVARMSREESGMVPVPVGEGGEGGGGGGGGGGGCGDGIVLPPPLSAAAAPPAGGGGGRSRSSAATTAVRQAIANHKKLWAQGGQRVAGKPIAVMPEGTCHNGHALIRFFSGAFEGGGPVQPVLLSYPYARINSAFFSSSLPHHLGLLFLAPWVRMHVRYLPVRYPTPEESADADLYAENVRQDMARAAGLPLSGYSAKDLRNELKEKAEAGLRHRE
jgi:1-acyl-sn-glycerol-3-phosphate acyltransferase